MLDIIQMLENRKKGWEPDGADALVDALAIETIATLRRTLMRARPYVAELAAFSAAAATHRDLSDEIDAALGYRPLATGKPT